MHLDRSLLAAGALFLAAGIAEAQPMLRAMPSTRATARVNLAFPRDSAPPGAQPEWIAVNYGQPHLRGRALHTDSLVPYGQPWRTGANEATLLVTTVDLTLGGQSVPKGRYVVWTLPAQEGWTMMLQRTDSTEPPPVGRYDASKNVARIPLRHTPVPVTVESLTFWLVPATNVAGAARGELRMAWGSSLLTADWVVR
jgi:hypothetical protein